MANSEGQPLSEWCSENLPARDALLCAGEPCGPLRLETLLGDRRKSGAIEIWGRPGRPSAEPQRLLDAEWHGFLFDEKTNRLVHVHSDETWYDAQAREPATDTIPEQHEALLPAAMENFNADPERQAAAKPDLEQQEDRHRREGRPAYDSRDLVKAEFQRRVANGRALPTITEESRELIRLVRENHPDKKPPSPRTVETWIRALPNPYGRAD